MTRALDDIRHRVSRLQREKRQEPSSRGVFARVERRRAEDERRQENAADPRARESARDDESAKTRARVGRHASSDIFIHLFASRGAYLRAPTRDATLKLCRARETFASRALESTRRAFGTRALADERDEERRRGDGEPKLR